MQKLLDVGLFNLCSVLRQIHVDKAPICVQIKATRILIRVSWVGSSSLFHYVCQACTNPQFIAVIHSSHTNTRMTLCKLRANQQANSRVFSIDAPPIGEPLLLDDETDVAETAAKAARASQRVFQVISGQLPAVTQHHTTNSTSSKNETWMNLGALGRL